ncbi:MAG TPA: hypothetical protein VN040_14230 [Pseudosphingobacterium sp.]|nr:hypothetical protein [Pseudosphingobacterium sp.]
MTNYNYAAIAAHCDKLTKKGDKLSIAWDGGNDSGWVYLKLNDNQMDNMTAIEEQLIRLAEDVLAYGSFDGDFSVEGEAEYNPAHKCFEGTDSYSGKLQVIKDCAIEISIPESIWFDRLELRFEIDDEYDQETTASLRVLNGPFPLGYNRLELKIANSVRCALNEEIRTKEDFRGVWQQYSIPRKEIQEKGKKLVYILNQFEYSSAYVKEKEVEIPLT